MDSEITDAIHTLFFRARDLYGDKVETFWFYDGELCPCCNKREIDKLPGHKEILLSLNAYMYHNFNVLIVYFLCSKCITDLPVVNKIKQKTMYNNIEKTLTDAYHSELKSSAS